MKTLNPQPGRFEGNESQLMARVLDEIIGNGFATDEFGDVEHGGHHALVLGKRYGFIALTDNYGFFQVWAYAKDHALKRFNELLAEYPTEEEDSDNDD
jgi:hypothetical protein